MSPFFYLDNSTYGLSAIKNAIGGGNGAPLRIFYEFLQNQKGNSYRTLVSVTGKGKLYEAYTARGSTYNTAGGSTNIIEMKITIDGNVIFWVANHDDASSNPTNVGLGLYSRVFPYGSNGTSVGVWGGALQTATSTSTSMCFSLSPYQDTGSYSLSSEKQYVTLTSSSGSGALAHGIMTDAPLSFSSSLKVEVRTNGTYVDNYVHYTLDN